MVRKKLREKNGAALMLALVIMAVVLALSFGLLLVSYNLLTTVSRQKSREQCRELSRSLSLALEKELTGVPKFESFEQQLEALNSGDYSLYFYLRYNLGQTGWPYYDPEQGGHEADSAIRKFTVPVGEEKGLEHAEVCVEMYWEGEQADDGTPWEEYSAENEVSLVVRVTCELGRQKSVDTSVYYLAVSSYGNGSSGGGSGGNGSSGSGSGENGSSGSGSGGNGSSGSGSDMDSTYAPENPNGYSISRNQRWDWSEAERK